MKVKIIEINKKHPDFKIFQWLITALSKNPEERRCHVVHLYCEKNLLVCTDGNRIHTYQSKEDDYSDGYYNVILNSPDLVFLKKNELIDKEFPGFEDILKPADVEPFQVYADCDFECSNVYAYILRRFGENHLNYNYLWDLLKFGFHFDCYVGGERLPVVFIKDSLKAAIMPMALKEYYPKTRD